MNAGNQDEDWESCRGCGGGNYGRIRQKNTEYDGETGGDVWKDWRPEGAAKKGVPGFDSIQLHSLHSLHSIHSPRYL